MTLLAEIPADLWGRPIERVDVVGEARGLLDAEALRLPLGTPLTRERLRDSARALLASGAWADVAYEGEPTPRGVRVVVTLSPRILLARIEVSGNATISTPAVLDLLGAREGSELTRPSLETFRRALLAELAERGFLDARVDVELRDTDTPSRKVLRVRVREGAPRRIAQLRFIRRTSRSIPETIEPPRNADVLGALGVGVGDPLDRRRLDEGLHRAIAHLRERGYLEAHLEPPVVDVDSGAVSIPARFGPRYRVEIHGHAPLGRSDVESVLDLGTERLSAAMLENVRTRIVDLYRRHGFHNPRVQLVRTLDPRRRRADDGTLDPAFAVLGVHIAPGRRLRVVGVSFPGATHFAHDLLRDQIRSYLEEDLPSSQPFEPVDSDVVDRIGLSGRAAVAARTIAAPLLSVPATVWMESTYAEAVQHIEELYRADGYLDVRVGPAELIPIEDDVAVVSVPVLEGTRTRIHDVRVRGNELIATRAILEAAGLFRGAPFSHVALEEARRRVIALYRDLGYFFARVEPSVHRSGDRERAEIVLDVVEAYPVRVGRIDVTGLERASESLVLQALRIAPGDLLRPESIRQSEEALLRLGIFTSVNVAPADPDVPERVKDLRVTVSERLPQELALSAGIGTGEGARGAFEYTYRNLFGYAVALSLRAQLGFQFFFQDRELERAITALSLDDRVERRIAVGLAAPHIPGVQDVRVSLDLVHLRDNFRDFGLDKNGAILAVALQPDRRLSGAVSAEIEHNTVSLFDAAGLREYLARPDVVNDPRTQRLLRVPDGESALASLRLVASADLRDSAFNPTEGAYVSAALEWARTLATEHPEDFSHFVKLTLTTTGYVELAERWVLALQARGGRVFHLEPGSRTYPNRAYFLGGVDSLRGFLQDQVIPQDQVEVLEAARASGRPLEAASIVRTGDFFYLGRAELRFPIAGELHGGAFVDFGNVWSFAEAMDAEDLLRVRVSAGLGLRLSTPVGPIAADYGVNLTRRDDQDVQEPFGAFHFSIGLF